MKKLGLLLILVFSFISCSNDDKEDAYFKGKWELTGVQTNFDPAANTIDDLPQWKETYVFSNGKFSKTRIKDGKTTTVTGTYILIEPEAGLESIIATGIKLELSYKKEDEDYVMSCTDLKEDLWIIAEKLSNNLRACEGPIYFYTEIK